MSFLLIASRWAGARRSSRKIHLVLGLAVLASASLLTPTLQADELAEGRRYALVVGVQNYDGAGLGNLRYCDNDASGLGEALQKLGYRVTLLTRTEWKAKDRDDLLPTADNIRDNLKAVLRNRKPADTVLLAFAGHGEQLKKDGKMYFCPAKCDLDKPDTLVGLDEVYALLKDNAAGAKVLIVDACRNDPLPGKSVGSEKLESVTRPDLPEPPGGTVALFSCAKGQVAYESDALKHGFLFHFVIEGLEGKAVNKKDGRITWLGLAKHVDDELPDAVREELGPKTVQTPEVRGRSLGLVLARLDSGAVVPPPDLTTTEASEKTEDFEYTVEGQPRRGVRTVQTLDLGGGVTMQLVRIPRGTLLMGAPDSDKDADEDEKPQHEVTITKDFYLGKCLVTKKHFARFVAATGYRTEAEADGKGGFGLEGKSFKQDPKFTWRDPGFDQADDHPVVEASWKDAKAFCDWAGATTKRDVRLPTEAEWEYACRAGTTTRYFTGEAPESLAGAANIADQTAKKQFPGWKGVDFADGYVFTSPVGSFRANPFGLYDMTGNVYEWCTDYSDPDYYRTSPKTDPENLVRTAKRLVRGGSWGNQAKFCRSFDRATVDADGRASTIGFRVVVGVR